MLMINDSKKNSSATRVPDKNPITSIVNPIDAGIAISNIKNKSAVRTDANSHSIIINPVNIVVISLTILFFKKNPTLIIIPNAIIIIANID